MTTFDESNRGHGHGRVVHYTGKCPVRTGSDRDSDEFKDVTCVVCKYVEDETHTHWTWGFGHGLAGFMRVLGEVEALLDSGFTKVGALRLIAQKLGREYELEQEEVLAETSLLDLMTDEERAAWIAKVSKEELDDQGTSGSGREV